jgi:hypothetical protein
MKAPTRFVASFDMHFPVVGLIDEVYIATCVLVGDQLRAYFRRKLREDVFHE